MYIPACACMHLTRHVIMRNVSPAFQEENFNYYSLLKCPFNYYIKAKSDTLILNFLM